MVNTRKFQIFVIHYKYKRILIRLILVAFIMSLVKYFSLQDISGSNQFVIAFPPEMGLHLRPLIKQWLKTTIELLHELPKKIYPNLRP